MTEESISLRDLHGSVLTVDADDGGRKKLAGFACDDYPDCEVCGHIDESLV